MTERAYVAPREALYALSKIQAAQAPLSASNQALVYELQSHAKFFASDFAGAISDARLLESLGQQQQDNDAECLGALSQVYPYWMSGKIITAYDIARRTERCLDTPVHAAVKIKVLLTRAQIETEERNGTAALATMEQALHLAATQADETLLFMTIRSQAGLALALNDIPRALAAVDRLLALAKRAPYPEQLVRARGLEYSVASAAGLTGRARQAVMEQIRLVKQLQLDETLGPILVDFANFQLKSKRYNEAEQLTRQALALETVLANEAIANPAHLNHALSNIYLGHVAEGKKEVETLFKSVASRADLLAYLPEYIAALSQAGDTEASFQAAALQSQVEREQDLYRAKEKSEVQGKIDTLSQLSELTALEARSERHQREIWLIVAATSALGLIAALALYGRLRYVNRLLHESNRQLYVSSNRDLLTGLFNRRYLESTVSRLPVPADRTPATDRLPDGLVVLMDIDHFKQVNDTHGHAVGDQVLQVVAGRLAELFHGDDIICRWGGEEFLALLPAAQAGEVGHIIARILEAVAAPPAAVGTVTLNITVSVGACSLNLVLGGRQATWSEVLNIADQLLYVAKQRGRNRACAITDASHASQAEMARGVLHASAAGSVHIIEVPGCLVPSPS